MSTPSDTAGYSGTPLPRKLGLRDGQRVLFVALPTSLGWLAEAADFLASERIADSGGVRADGYDVIHAFFLRRADLAGAAKRLMAAIKPDGMIWVSWPKKASKRPTDITENVVREIALPLGLVDVKVCAVDEVWSGLKLVIRKSERPRSAGRRA